MTEPAPLLLRFKPEERHCVLCPTNDGRNISHHKMYTFLASRGMFYQKHLINEVSVATNPSMGSSTHVVKCKKGKGKERYLYYMLRLLKENPSSNFAPDSVVLDVGAGAAAVKYVRKNIACFGCGDDAHLHAVSELGLYALTSADDRMGMSARFLVLQTALLRYFAALLAKIIGLGGSEAVARALDPYDPLHTSDYSDYLVWEKVRFGDAVASIVSSLRWLFTLKKNYEKAAALGTSAVWLTRDEAETTKLIDCISELAFKVSELASCGECMEQGYGVKFVSDCSLSNPRLVFVVNGKEFHTIGCGNVLGMFLGRAINLVMNLSKVPQALGGRVENKELTLVIEWSEQSGPIDIALILTSLMGIRNLNLGKVVILSTPLAYAHAVATGLYLKRLLGRLKEKDPPLPSIGEPGMVSTSLVMTSGSDPVYVVALLKRLVREVKGEDGHMLYFLGGSTLHSMIASYILMKKELRERVTVLSR